MSSRLNRWFTSWKKKAGELEKLTTALVYAFRDPRTPWYAKGLVAIIVAYAFSPIDLIPDFIPVLGYLDDLILIPLGVTLALKLIPKDVMADATLKAARRAGEPQPKGRLLMGVLIVLVWIIVIGLVATILTRTFGG